MWIEASLDDVDNDIGPRPFNDCCVRACVGSFGSNKIDFSSASEGFWEVGCSREERRNFLWALLYVTMP